MDKRTRGCGNRDDVDAVTRAVLTASRALVAVSARSLTAVEGKVTLPQFRLLVVLWGQGPVRLSTVAEELGVNPSTAMRMVDRLVAAGFAERRARSGSRRENWIELTGDGRRIVEEVIARRRREVAAIVERMAPEQGAALVSALTAFSEAAGEPTTAYRGRDPYPLGWADNDPADHVVDPA
ncbi:MarR family winged helix-turn-helix transcriptional regulator [Streptomyces chrestomyceticus]|uniref:MarR family winged helix-turn-helix transcriptional regulator n=1 Tax=Streptomyces chrestomyceticus TaxID=68185 RepID=UPI0033F33B24